MQAHGIRDNLTAGWNFNWVSVTLDLGTLCLTVETAGENMTQWKVHWARLEIKQREVQFRKVILNKSFRLSWPWPLICK